MIKAKKKSRGTTSCWIYTTILGIISTGLLLFFIRFKPQPGPSIVVVTGLDVLANYPGDYLTKIVENRKEYADAHNYGLYVRYLTDFQNTLQGAETSWARVSLVRAAMKAYPRAKYFWYLDQHSIIMNPSIELVNHALAPNILKTIIRRGVPVVLPESVIKTYKNVKPERVNLILSQDYRGVQTASWVIENGDYGKYLLEIWFDRLYRSYFEFKRHEQSALEHILQWHPTVLSRAAFIPSRKLISYPQTYLKLDPKIQEFPDYTPEPWEDSDLAYQPGDLVLSFYGCDESSERDCVKEFEMYWDARGRVAKHGSGAAKADKKPGKPNENQLQNNSPSDHNDVQALKNEAARVPPPGPADIAKSKELKASAVADKLKDNTLDNKSPDDLKKKTDKNLQVSEANLINDKEKGKDKVKGKGKETENEKVKETEKDKTEKEKEKEKDSKKKSEKAKKKQPAKAVLKAVPESEFFDDDNPDDTYKDKAKSGNLGAAQGAAGSDADAGVNNVLNHQQDSTQHDKAAAGSAGKHANDNTNNAAAAAAAAEAGAGAAAAVPGGNANAAGGSGSGSGSGANANAGSGKGGNAPGKSGNEAVGGVVPVGAGAIVGNLA